MDTHRLPHFGFDEENYAVVVMGRRVSLDDLERAGLTQRQIRSLHGFVQSWASDTGLPLAWVHMGTSVNWYEDREDRMPKEGADAVVGVVIAHTAYQNGAPPLALSRSALQTAPAVIPTAFWAALASQYGLAPTTDALVLAPAGWAVAEIYDGSLEYDRAGHSFGANARPLLQTCSEDFPPGVDIEPSQWPERLWLRAFYA